LASSRWATVTGISPLRIKLDGDTTAIPTTPDSLINPATLAVDDRVRTELSGNRLVVLGRVDGVLVADAASLAWGSLTGKPDAYPNVISEMDAADGPEDYPVGTTIFQIGNTGTEWPERFGIVTTTRIVDYRCIQVVQGKDNEQIWTRVADNTDNWRAWRRIAQPGYDGVPFAQAAGTAEPSGSGTYQATVAITFPAGRFSVPPKVTLGGDGTTSSSGTFSGSVENTTSSAFTLRWKRVTGQDFSARYDVDWHAIQMTEWSASG